MNSLASYCYNTINFSQAASQKVGSERSFESTFDKFLERRTKGSLFILVIFALTNVNS